MTASKAGRRYWDSDKMLFRKEISRLLQKEAIKQEENLEKGYASSIFLREKEDKTTHQLILNLKKINESVLAFQNGQSN